MSQVIQNNPTADDDEMPVVATIVCPTCSGIVEADDKFCPYCGAPQAAPQKPEQPSAPPDRHFRCKNCGAEVAVDRSQRSYVCPFCDSTYVVEFSPELTGRQQPEFVIGFAVTPEKAREIFERWLNENRWFRPADLKAAALSEKLRGIYIPFWSFSMLARSTWQAMIGEYWYRTETYTTTENGKTVTKTRRVRETEWWPLAGRHHQFHNGYLISGSRGLPQELADRITPFHLAGMRRYEPYFLAGWACEEYTINREQAEAISRRVFEEWERNEVAAFMPGDTHQLRSVDVRFENASSDLILLPVYLLTYTYRDKKYHFLINGQTGKHYGTKPLSWAKIGLAAAAGIAALLVVAGVLWLLV